MSAPLLQLAARFAAMLAVLAALGSGPASLLPRAWPRAARAGLAPVLGLSLAACLFTTLEWFLPGDRVGFVVPLACVASLSAGAWRWRGGRRAPTTEAARPRAGRALLAAGELAAVCAAAFLPVATALAAHASVGPMTYEVFDGPGYVANAQAAQTTSIHAAATSAPAGNYVARWWAEDAASSNRLDYAPVVAAMDALLGLDATGTYAADLLAVVAAGGLALYGAVLVATPRRAPLLATLAGTAFGGSFFMQLVFDGSQAALTGLAVLVPLTLVLTAAARSPGPANLAVSALLVAGLATLYPIFLFPVVLAVLAAGGVALLRRARGGQLARGELAAWARRAAAVLAGAAALDVVATARDARSLGSIVAGGGILSSFPAYHLGAGVLASWLFQTRDLYGVAFGPQSPTYDLVPALLVPLAVVVAALPGLRRNPFVWLPLLVVAVSLALGAYEAVHNGCGYCEDRSMLSSVPPLAFLVFTGLGTVIATGRHLARAGVAAVSLAYLGYAAYDAANARARYAAGSVYLTSSLRSLVARIPRDAGPVELEGFGAVPSSMAAEPYLYELVLARTGQVSAATAEEGSGLAEDWGPEPLSSPLFRPGYTYVLSRLAAVGVARTRIASDGAAVLERRVAPDDVTVESGIAFPTVTALAPEVTGPLVFVVAGPGHGPEVVRARFAVAAPGVLRAGPGLRPGAGGSQLEVCVPATGRPPERTARAVLPVAAGLRLEAMAAEPGPC